MIKDKTVYTYICDKCGKDICDETDYIGWNDLGVYDIYDEGWVEVGDKHYCPDCYDYNEEDELIIIEL